MTEIHYYRAAAGDTGLLIDFRIRFLTEYFGAQPQDVTDTLRQELQAYYHRALADSSYICWLAVYGQEVAGIGGMAIRQYPGSLRNPSGKSGYILNMYTRPEYRRQGISTTILRRLMESAEAQGIHFFELHATGEGEPVYVKAGFEKHAEPTYRKFLAAGHQKSGNAE